MDGEIVRLGKWGREGVEALLHDASAIADAAARIDFISAAFAGVPYSAGTLPGPQDGPEHLVIDLSQVDCFTYIDYVEAMRLSASYDAFAANLARVRYKRGKIAYAARRHFFTDWASTSHVTDVTAAIGGKHARTELKVLNRKADGSLFVPGIPEKRRRVAYIPSPAAGLEAAAGLRTGDYIGIYAEDPGLDVTHTGIAVIKGGKPIFRHASQVEGKVIDVHFISYLAAKPGIIVLRPR